MNYSELFEFVQDWAKLRNSLAGKAKITVLTAHFLFMRCTDGLGETNMIVFVNNHEACISRAETIFQLSYLADTTTPLKRLPLILEETYAKSVTCVQLPHLVLDTRQSVPDYAPLAN